MANPNRDQWLDSFQGKTADDVKDTSNQQTLDALRRDGYRIDGTGSPNPQDIDYNPQHGRLYNPRRGQNPGYNITTTATSNPQPEDPSRFDPPPPDPIRITQSEALTVPAVNVNDVDVELSESGKLERIQLTPGRTGRQDLDLTDRGSSGKTVSSDAPEEVYGMEDEYDEDKDSKLSEYGSADGTETGPPIGLNESARIKTEVANTKDAKGINTAKRKVFSADLSAVKIESRPNELNKFASHTYNLALYMLNSKSYVNLLTAPNTPQAVLADSMLLMRSGGVGLDNADTAFNNDFFIDNLQITNVAVSPNKFKSNTNATDIKFSITEPRGVTLLERLRDAAAQSLEGLNERYIHAPYLLEITFKGYDDNGQPVPAPSRPKYIPIRITDISFDVSAQGTEYQVDAIPFAHHLYGGITSIIPMNIELKAKTIGNIFSEGIQTFTTNTEVAGYRYDDDDEGEGEPITKEVTTYGASYKNLGDVLTANQKRRTEPTTKKSAERSGSPGAGGGYEQITIPAQSERYDTYEFLIATEIADAQLNIENLFDSLNTPVPTKDGKTDKADVSQFQAYAQGLGSGISIDKETQTFKINAGTDVTKLLNLIIMHSDYMDKNVVENAEKGISDGKPINWFKIKPIIKSAEGPGKGFDGKDGRYKYNIVYVVEPSVIYYHDFPWAPKSKPKGNGIHKIYDYIYTGNNTEVLDFRMKFSTAFVQVMTTGTGNPGADKSTKDDFANLIKEQTISAEGNTINSGDNLTRARAKDLFSSVMSDGVDMVELDMQVKGDPAYIPTSDAYWQDKVRQGEQYATAFMPDGTINFDFSPPYIQVNLKTPVDYDNTTGLANPNQFGNSTFSGVYRLMQIESVFSGGVFDQRLMGLRATLQPGKLGLQRQTSDNAGLERQLTQKEELPNEATQGKKVTTTTAKVTGRQDYQGAPVKTYTGQNIYATADDVYPEVPQQRGRQDYQGAPVSDVQAVKAGGNAARDARTWDAPVSRGRQDYQGAPVTPTIQEETPGFTTNETALQQLKDAVALSRRERAFND